MSLFRNITLNTDNATGDAFGRLRIVTPEYAFDSQFEYDLQPLLFEAVTNGSGATVTHDATNRNALMTFASTPTGGSAYLQTYEHFRYQAGRSQMVLVSFNLLGGVADCLKFAGYSNGSNGIEFQLNGTTPRFALYSDTAKGDEFVNQADWNVDKLDGTGPSGLTLNFAKTQILVIDFQWLGVGRVRVGFDVDGVVVVAHQFTHANIQEVAYMQSANLPVRVGMTCTGTVSTTMRGICTSVASEGGQQDVAGYAHSYVTTGTAGNGANAHIVSLRPKTTFNSISNRTKMVLETVEVIVTGSNPVSWELVLGQAITGASWADVNTAYSATEASAGTSSGSPGVVIASGFVPASNQTKGTATRSLSNRYPVTLDAAGAVRTMGTLSLLATGIGGTSAIRAAVTWREIR